MSTITRVRLAAWAFLGLGVVALARTALAPVAATGLPPATPVAGEEPAVPRRKMPDLDSIKRAVTEWDLFRRSRRPAPAATSVGGTTPPSGQPRPVLRLVGFVAGNDPSALIEGLPGTAGPRAVRQGDVIGPLTVRRITATAVEVVGMDTTWTLTVRGSWDLRR
jgi:hypothetical protein